MTALYSILITTAFLSFAVAAYFRFRPDAVPEDAPSADAPRAGTDTEFTAEVVRITEILPHPNADRLEIAKFEMKSGPVTYEVVIGKGTLKVGDIAAYLSVDCIVPIALPQFKFLGERLDGKGKTHYRLKAARLRGVFSQGLLVNLPARGAYQYPWALGDSVAKEFAVTYYTPPEDRYHAQQGPNRDARRAVAQPMPVYTVDSLKKLPNLFAEGEPVAVTEKVHGSNARFGWLPKKFLGIRTGWKFVVGSHRVIKSTDKPGGWYGQGEADDIWLTVAEQYGLREKLRKYPGLMFYGEIYGFTKSGKKIQDMTYDRSPADGPGLRFFDVRDPKRGWLNYDERVALLRELGLDIVPLVTIGEWSKDLLTLAEGPSLIAPEQIREGVVIESMTGPRRKAKFVGQGYLLREDGGKYKVPKGVKKEAA